MGDVWAAYALDPGVVQDVLITPHKKATAAVVAQMIPLGIRAARAGAQSRKSAAVQAAESEGEGRLSARPRGCEAVFRRSAAHPCAPDTMVEPVEDQERILKIDQANLRRLLEREPDRPGNDPEDFTSLERYIALAGLIYWVGKLERPSIEGSAPPQPVERLPRLTVKEAFQSISPISMKSSQGCSRFTGSFRPIRRRWYRMISTTTKKQDAKATSFRSR